MSELAPFVAAALRDKVVEELEKEARKLRQEKTQLMQFAVELSESAGLVTIRSSGGQMIYAYGTKDPEVQYDDPFRWFDVEEHVEMRHPQALPAQQCPIEEVGDAELHLAGGLILKLRDCDRSMLASFHHGYVTYYYIFEQGQFAPMVDILVKVKFGPVLDWESRGLSMYMEDRDVRFNPSSFQNKDIASVVFERVNHIANFPSDGDDGDSDDGDDEMND